MAKVSGRDAIEAIIAKRKLAFRFMRHDAWENALFLHWPVDPAFLAAHLPRGLEPDIMDGTAWVGLVLLTERGVSAYHSLGRMLVRPIDHLGANIRTYVRRDGVPGIFFWSLECSSILAALGARLAGIPYFPASMRRTVDVERPVARAPPPALAGGAASPSEPSSCFGGLFGGPKAPGAEKAVSAGDDFVFEFSSVRSGFGWSRPSVTARWRLKPTVATQDGDAAAGDNAAAEERATFLRRANWFVERYSVYAAWPLGRGPVLLRGDVQHPQWPMQAVEIEDLNADSLFAAAGLSGIVDKPDSVAPPHACFSRGVGPVDFWMLEPV